MAELQYAAGTSYGLIINDGATLADGVRSAGNHDNSTNRNLWGLVFLTVQYDGGPPTAGDLIANLYIIPGNGAGSEVFADGGDAGLGTNDTPQQVWHVGAFESINPSTSVDEVLALPVRLYPDGNLFVIENTSGQTFDATWELGIRPIRYESV